MAIWGTGTTRSDVGGGTLRYYNEDMNGTIDYVDTKYVSPGYYDMATSIVEMNLTKEFTNANSLNSNMWFCTTADENSASPSANTYADVYKFGASSLGSSPGITQSPYTKTVYGAFAIHKITSGGLKKIRTYGNAPNIEEHFAIYGYYDIPAGNQSATTDAWPGMAPYNQWAYQQGYDPYMAQYTSYYSITVNSNNTFACIRHYVEANSIYTIKMFTYSEQNYDGIMISTSTISSSTSFSSFTTGTGKYKLSGVNQYQQYTYSPSSNGYLYIYYKTDGSTLKYDNSYSIGDVEIRKTYTSSSSNVTLNKNAGSGGTSSFTTQWGSIVSVGTVPTRSGYGGNNSFTFLGYYDRPTCNMVNFTGIQYINSLGNSNGRKWNRYGPVTLYAGWRNNVTYTLYSNPVQIYASEKNPTATTLDRSVTFDLGHISTSSGTTAIGFSSSLSNGITATMDSLVNNINVVKVTIPSGTTASNYAVEGYIFAQANAKTTISSPTNPNTYISNKHTYNFPSWTLNIVQNTVQSIRLYLGKSSIEIGEKTNIMPEAKLASGYVVNLMGASGSLVPTYTQSNSSNIVSTTEMHLSRHLVIYVDDFTYSDVTDSAALISQADADTQMYAEDAGFSTWEEYIAAYVKDPMSFNSNKYVYTGTMDLDTDGDHSDETYYIWECVSENANNCWCSYLITDTIDVTTLKNSSLKVNPDYSRFFTSSNYRHVVGYLDRDMMYYKLFNKFEWIVRVDEFSEV